MRKTVCSEHEDLSLFNSVLMGKVGTDTQLSISFKKDLTHSIYSYEFDISFDHTQGFNVYMYGECGGAGFSANTPYRYWSSDYL